MVAPYKHKTNCNKNSNSLSSLARKSSIVCSSLGLDIIGMYVCMYVCMYLLLYIFMYIQHAANSGKRERTESGRAESDQMLSCLDWQNQQSAISNQQSAISIQNPARKQSFPFYVSVYYWSWGQPWCCCWSRNNLQTAEKEEGKHQKKELSTLINVY